MQDLHAVESSLLDWYYHGSALRYAGHVFLLLHGPCIFGHHISDTCQDTETQKGLCVIIRIRRRLLADTRR